MTLPIYNCPLPIELAPGAKSLLSPTPSSRGGEGEDTGSAVRANPEFALGARVAFTLLELLVTVALLSFIILGLLAMFLQTQRAFRGSMKQVDVLEAGRAVTEMLTRELAQITPSRMPYTTNFLSELSFANPLYQDMPGTGDRRTNVVQNFFFLTQLNQDWIGTGYKVLPDDATRAVGTLYRLSRTNRSAAFLLVSNFVNEPLTNFSRIAGGIVHLRVRAFDTNGFLITPGISLLNARYSRVKNTSGYWDGPAQPDQMNCYFASNAVPAYLELEMGVLEPHVLERYKAISPANATGQRSYLSTHIAQVHLFRQRVPIRNVDFRAYQ